MFGPKKAEVTGKWVRMRIEELLDTYSLSYIIQVGKY
jgi:hypothetical protein